MIIPSTKSKQYLPIISKAKGKYVLDTKGNKYLDFTGSNLTVIHGYRPAISCVPNLPGRSSVEQELINLLSNYTNRCDFRFFKNGHDAVDCAVRLAVHLTLGKFSSLYYMGYHGTGEAYIYTTDNNNGCLGHGEHSFIGQLKPGDKPMCGKCDILVFESRYAKYADEINAKIKICDTLKDGIRALYYSFDTGIKPLNPFYDGNIILKGTPYDFTLYGKSIANGSALAIMTGKEKYMKRINEIYYSTTFGCNQDAMIEAIRTIKDFEKVKNRYFDLYNYAKEILPEWRSLNEQQIKKFQKYGILFNGYWQIFTVHNKKDIDTLKKAIDIIL